MFITSQLQCSRQQNKYMDVRYECVAEKGGGLGEGRGKLEVGDDEG